MSLRNALLVALALAGLPALARAEESNESLVHVRAPLTDDVRAVAQGNNRFAIDMYRELVGAAKPGENLLVSPLSISTALAMTYAGARGRTAEQMANTLHFTLADDRLHAGFGAFLSDLDAPREGYELNIANRLFGQQGMAFKQAFLQTVDSSYGAALEQLDFVNDAERSRLHINDWVADQTQDLIKDMLPPGSVNSDTRLVLTNAVYFNGAWKYKFDAADTRDAAFHLADGSQATASFMYQKTALRHASMNGYQALELPYAGNDLSMLVLLPDKADGLADLEATLSEASLQATVNAMSEKNVEVYLPKFSFEDEFGLNEALQNLGMTDVFDPSVADLTGMTDGNLYVTGVLHKTFIEVSEEGTEAAAATAVVIGTTCVCGPPPSPIFNADHPFLFALRDTHTGSLMFMGRVMETDSIAARSSVPEPSTTILMGFGLVLFVARRSKRSAFAAA